MAAISIVIYCSIYYVDVPLHLSKRKISESFSSLENMNSAFSVPMGEVTPATLPRGAPSYIGLNEMFDPNFGRRAWRRARCLHFSRCVQIALGSAL